MKLYSMFFVLLALLSSGSMIIAGSSESVVVQRQTAPEPLQEILQLINQRLAVMHDVARWKWVAGKPVSDPQREEAMLHDIESKCTNLGLDPIIVKSFFVAQIEAGKMVQEDDIRKWKEGKPLPEQPIPDLISNTRPKLDGITISLLSSLARLKTHKQKEDRRLLQEQAKEIIAGEGITEAVRKKSIEPLELMLKQ